MRILQPLRQRDFRLLWAGLAISLLGDGVYFVAVAFQAYALHNDPAALALVGFAWTGGMVVFLLAGGVVSDRLPRRRVMMGADAVRALALATMGVLSLTGALELWMLAALAALYGAGEAFFGPAFSAFVPEIVAADQLVAANSLQHAMQPLGQRVAGPALGGAIVAGLGPGPGFLVDAATFVVSLGCLAAMRVREPPAQRGARGAGAEIRAGLAYVRSQTWLWATLLAAAIALLVFYGPIEVLVPYLLKNELGGGPGAFGLFLAANGLGWVIGSLWLSGRELPRRPVTFMYLLWGFGTFVLCAYALAAAPWQLMALGFAFGLPMALGVVVWSTLMQTRVPRELRGRVSSLDWFVSIGLTPVSFALTAPVAGAIGIDATFVLAGAIGGGSTLALLAFVPGLREQRGEVVDEARVGDGGGLHADDLDAVGAREAGDGAEHRHPVVAAGVERPPAQPAGADDGEAVGGRLGLAAESAQAVDDPGDPV